MKALHLLPSAIYLVAALACSPPPEGSSSDAAQPISGTERFGWDQPAADLTELGSFRFAVYVDGVRSAAPEVTCGTAPGTSGFPCTCSLPPLSTGTHTLQVAAFIDDAGTLRESERSAGVRVLKR